MSTPVGGGAVSMSLTGPGGSPNFGPMSLDVNGLASQNWQALADGTYTGTASYSGDSDTGDLPSSTNVSVTVDTNSHDTAITVTFTPTTPSSGQPVVIAFSVQRTS